MNYRVWICTVLVASVVSRIALAATEQIEVVGWGLDGVSYEVWASNKACPWNDGTGYYNAPNYGYTLIGTANGPSTFTVNKDYRYYVVGTRGEMQLDAIRDPKGDYLPSESYGPLCWTLNSHLPYQYDGQGQLIGSPMDYVDWSKLWGAPDGQTNNLGFPVGKGSTGGVLHGGVVFENRNALAALCIGSNDSGGVKGQTDASNVYNAMSKLGDWTGGMVMDFNIGVNDSSAQQKIFSALKSGESQLRKNDVAVFFYAGHGSGSTAGQAEPEAMAYTGLVDQWITDETLASWFDGTGGVGAERLDPSVWNNVNKLFIMDSCHSGGFWGGDDGADLSRLPRAALLAACSETGFAYSDQNGEGYFSQAVAAAFALVSHEGGEFAAADKNFDGMTFEELQAFVAQYGLLYYPANGSVDLNLRDSGTAPFIWSTGGWSSSDFEIGAIGAPAVVPEPSSLAMLLFAGLSLFAPAVVGRFRRRA